MAAMEQKSDELLEKHDAAMARSDQILARSDQLLGKVDDLQETNDGLVGKVDDLEETVDDLQQTIEETNENLQEATDKVDIMTSHIVEVFAPNRAASPLNKKTKNVFCLAQLEANTYAMCRGQKLRAEKKLQELRADYANFRVIVRRNVPNAILFGRNFRDMLDTSKIHWLNSKKCQFDTEEYSDDDFIGMVDELEKQAYIVNDDENDTNYL